MEERIFKLTDLLNAYDAHKQHFLELACRKADAQRQMNFIQQLKETVSPPSRRHSPNEDLNEDVEKPKQRFLYTNL